MHTHLFFFFTEDDIDKFMQCYRTTFPHSTVTPKLHMLECHVVGFIRLWGVGLGMLGEQGAESIHTRFNQLERTYSSMANPVQRLQSVVAEHFRQVCPTNIVREPPVKKRKTEVQKT